MKALTIATAMWVLALSMSSASAFNEIKCSTDAIFAANSCHQCFDWGAKWEGAHLGLLSDDWENTTGTSKIMYKEEQNDPQVKMINLDSSSVSWKQVPGSAGFWEYPQELEQILDEDEEGYVLPKNGLKKVTWLKSKLWYAYHLQKNKAAAGKNIGLMKYTIITHDIDGEGNINTTSNEHNECVLYKSGSPVEKKELNTGSAKQAAAKGKTLPKTGPEHYVLLLLLAMLAGFGFMKLRKKA